jgi:hypothetical protein
MEQTPMTSQTAALFVLYEDLMVVAQLPIWDKNVARMATIEQVISAVPESNMLVAG